MHTSGFRIVFGKAALLLMTLGLSLAGCEKDDPEPPPAHTKPPRKTVELTDAFIVRATAALAERLKPETKILEIRATGDALSLHMQAEKDLPASDKHKAIFAGALVQVDYVERPGADGQPPLGMIRGPVKVEVRGDGEVEDNLFPFSEVDLAAISRVFHIAVKAVDPADGKVQKLVVRRNLPFGQRVRGRIFVRSPRMSGSIDVNENGTPLKW